MNMKVIKRKKNGKVQFEFTRTEAFLLKQIKREFWPRIDIGKTAVRLVEIALGRRRAPWHYSEIPDAVKRFRYEARSSLAQQYPGKKF